MFGAQKSFAGGLSLQDEQLAAEMAGKIAWQAERTGSHPLGLQTLSIEKQEQKNSSGTRLVRVYQYDYSQESARVLVLDLLDQILVREQLIDNIHLPLNSVEIDYAISILASHDVTVDQLRIEQRRRGRAEFVQLSELEIKASIFEPMDPEHSCSRQRCALLSLFDDTRTVFTVEPVVHLGDARLELLAQQ
ncbi:MAG: hypothetical protein AB8B79_03280 [Granulosicoccus sp.]